jgi:glycosyltransferase involved in cell wall biosynthesis
MPDFIRHKETGMLVAPGDTGDLVDALTWLLDHPAERRQIAETGHLSIRDAYSWDAVGDSLRAEILAVMAGGPVSTEDDRASAASARL